MEPCGGRKERAHENFDAEAITINMAQIALSILTTCESYLPIALFGA